MDTTSILIQLFSFAAPVLILQVKDFGIFFLGTRETLKVLEQGNNRILSLLQGN